MHLLPRMADATYLSRVSPSHPEVARSTADVADERGPLAMEHIHGKCLLGWPPPQNGLTADRGPLGDCLDGHLYQPA